MNVEEFYMKRCLDLAYLGIGNTAPNPMVGSIIVNDKDTIIGEGYHQKYGHNHAEVNAINSISNKNELSVSTLYVSLEPCSHTGKTPPCVDLIIKHKIPKVVIGCKDPFSEVNGRGIKALKKAGVIVKVGIFENECLEINKRFFTFHNKKRPYIILKWAQTRDLFIDKIRNEKSKGINWITSTNTQKLTHKWRAEEDAILTGKNTIVFDKRAEEVSLKQSADAIISRALGSLNYFVEKTKHMLKKDGSLYAMKGKNPESEIRDLNKAWTVAQIKKIDVPYLEAERHLITITRKHKGG